jgi:tetratricopeptide (TPR) repeat protein
MRFPKTLTLLMLVTALVPALPARSRRKNVAQGPLFGPAAFPSACVASALPRRARQEFQAPRSRPACADVAASLPRHGGVKPPLRRAALKDGATTAMSPAAKPFTRAQVVSMVRDGFGDESGAKLIEQRRIDFAPSEDFIQTLKAAGASEAFVKALRAAKPPEPAGAKKPINQVQVFALLVGQVPSHRVSMLVEERGIDFEPTDDYLQEVRLAGGEDELVTALKGAKVTKPEHIDPALQARQAEVGRHVRRGVEFFLAKRFDEAEAEYRAALRLDPENEFSHDMLASVLGVKGDLDGEIAEYRVALRLNPKNELVHAYLGAALGRKGDWDGEIAEEREALDLNPNNENAHMNLGDALDHKNDWDSAIAEFREALRLKPSDDFAHANLGAALGQKGDWDGAIAEEHEALRLNPDNESAHLYLSVALKYYEGDRDGEIAEYREALRLNPKNAHTHVSLGEALGDKGDWDGAIVEFREALRLNPNDEDVHAYLGAALGQKGDYDGSIAEYREALRLNPKNENAHLGLGVSLGVKGDRDGKIAEEREALRLNPNNGIAHHLLGAALEQKGDRQGALQEYRAAYELNPQDRRYRNDYERLLQHVNQ